jgi:hypothetical protein
MTPTPPGPIALVADLLIGPRRRREAFLIARSMTSLGRFSALALLHRQAQARVHVGVGQPALGRDGDFARQLGEQLGAAASARPLRCMMFLNLEWPAMARSETPVAGSIQGEDPS